MRRLERNDLWKRKVRRNILLHDFEETIKIEKDANFLALCRCKLWEVEKEMTLNEVRNRVYVSNIIAKKREKRSYVDEWPRKRWNFLALKICAWLPAGGMNSFTVVQKEWKLCAQVSGGVPKSVFVVAENTFYRAFYCTDQTPATQRSARRAQYNKVCAP